MSVCKQCQSSFEITDRERVLRDQIASAVGGKNCVFPDPKLCPQCRRQRRLVFRNERHMYHRKCDLTGKQIIAIYPPDAPFPVYDSEAWFGNSWDPRDYGQEFDFSRPFFEQFAELQKKVPRLSRVFLNNENCDFCNIVGDSKNCYLIYGSIYCEDCYYGSPFYCKNCVDSLVIRRSEYCYECIDSDTLYECQYCQDCSTSHNLSFCYDLEGCRDCFMCVGLRHKQYYILNKLHSKADYEAKMKEIKLGSHSVIQHLKKQFQEFKLRFSHKFMSGTGNENVVGDHLYNSKDCYWTFFSQDCEGVGLSTQLLNAHHVLSCDYGEYGSFLYEVSGHYKVMNCAFCSWIWDNTSNLLYCEGATQGSKDCFGCVSMKRGQYCILNKQYTKEEYERMVERIVEHMVKTGEWGQFFPPEYSLFGYNETLAYDYFPLSKEEVLERGWKWRDDMGAKSYKGPLVEIPDLISDTSDDICDKILICEVSGKPYKIIPQEFAFYRRFSIPLPRRCPDVRYYDRLALRNPCYLWNRECAKCKKPIQTSYAPERPETVLCEECYLNEVY
ncbi:hypothetical protein COY07_04875 [Candidatus Peregrinibacteria bacterium CG_4_10_14_0_2_um_filter_43_11]|nr:MAG: hypothetical protein COY07_04875 [Candidatus Peregrinibacteria bacterium CG_4_10_14_0_2_um_filter_43_11]